MADDTSRRSGRRSTATRTDDTPPADDRAGQGTDTGEPVATDRMAELRERGDEKTEQEKTAYVEDYQRRFPTKTGDTE